MRINRDCQICERRPRTKVIYFWHGGGQIWLLCDECTQPGSKFCPGKYVDFSSEDITERSRHQLNDTHLKDVHKMVRGTGSYPYAFIFRFKGGDRHEIYMKVPELWSDYHHQKILCLTSRVIVQVGHDCAIEVLDFKFDLPDVEKVERMLGIRPSMF